MEMGGKSSGPSIYEIEAMRKASEKKEQERLEKEKRDAIAAIEAQSTEGSASGGEGYEYEGGALGGKRKRGSTLAGEGEQTFGKGGSLGG